MKRYRWRLAACVLLALGLVSASLIATHWFRGLDPDEQLRQKYDDIEIGQPFEEVDLLLRSHNQDAGFKSSETSVIIDLQMIKTENRFIKVRQYAEQWYVVGVFFDVGSGKTTGKMLQMRGKNYLIQFERVKRRIIPPPRK